MKQVSYKYKEALTKYGKQIDSIITYEVDNETITLDNTQLNSITPSYEGSILKSVMKELKIDSNVEIPLDTIINYRFGVKVGDSYEYIDFGNYVVYKVEKKEDTNSFEITCYDKMLYTMKDYEVSNISYPITIRNYINVICQHLGLTFKNANEEFANYDKLIANELYLNTDNNSIGYTYRDVLDEIAQATGSMICINNDDQLEIRYIDEIIEEGKNKLNKNGGYTLGYYDKTTKQYVNDNTWAIFDQPIKLDETGGTFSSSISSGITFANIYVYQYDANDNLISISSDIGRILRINYSSRIDHIRIGIQKNSQTIITNEFINNLEVMFEDGLNVTSYEAYIEPTFVINERSLKDINVNFGEKYGPINSIVLSRGEADNVYIQDEDSIEENGLCEIKIVDNQILKNNDRSDYLPDLLEKLDGLEYYLNDYSSTGITILDPADRYIVQIGENQYPCVAFNDEINITQGLEENIHTELPKESETDYTKADKTDRKLNQTIFIVDKHEQEIQALIEKVVDVSAIVEGTGEVELENAFEGPLHKLEIRGNISKIFPNDSTKYGYSLMISDDTIVNNDLYISSGVPYQNEVHYPSSTLYPRDSYIQVDEDLYKLDFDYLNYMNETTYDKYVYEEGKQWIERNVGIDSNGDMYPLANTVIEQKEDIVISVKENSIITLLSFGNGIFKIEYLLKNNYTDTFATKVYVDSEIKQTADEINAEVKAKVDEDEIVAKLNLGIRDGQGIVELKGNTVIIDSDNFQLDAEGNVTCQDATMDDTIMNTATINNATITGGEIILTTQHNYPKFKVLGIGQNVGAELSDADLSFGEANDRYCYIGLNGLSFKENGTNILTSGYSTTSDNQAIMYFMEFYRTDNLHKSWINSDNMGSTEVWANQFINMSKKQKKKNVEKFDKGLDILKDIDIYTYNYKEETKKSNKKHYGVVIGDDYNYSQEITDNKNEGVDLYSFISVCCASIKEQQEEIEQLQKEIKLLKEDKNGKNKLSK